MQGLLFYLLGPGEANRGYNREEGAEEEQEPGLHRDAGGRAKLQEEGGGQAPGGIVFRKGRWAGPGYDRARGRLHLYPSSPIVRKVGVHQNQKIWKLLQQRPRLL